MSERPRAAFSVPPTQTPASPFAVPPVEGPQWPGIHKARGPRTPSQPPQLGALLTADDMPDDVPEFTQAVLDEPTLRRLFADVQEQSRVLQATVKQTPTAPPRAVKRLCDLLGRLVERRVFGAQLRYEHAGSVWLDTLIVTTGGVRLARLQANG